MLGKVVTGRLQPKTEDRLDKVSSSSSFSSSSACWRWRRGLAQDLTAASLRTPPRTEEGHRRICSWSSPSSNLPSPLPSTPPPVSSSSCPAPPAPAPPHGRGRTLWRGPERSRHLGPAAREKAHHWTTGDPRAPWADVFARPHITAVMQGRSEVRRDGLPFVP